MEHQIRAVYDGNHIVVYQAFNKLIATSAITHQKFISPPFKSDRMTWIKPSFLWMMYRSGWGKKENQEFILQIKITRKGFEWLLMNSCLSHFNTNTYQSREEWQSKLNLPVRIQWDPERNIFLQPLYYRSIQIGLSNIAVQKYIDEFIVEIEDITEYCNDINNLLLKDNIEVAKKMLPNEVIYPLPKNICKIINSY